MKKLIVLLALSLPLAAHADRPVLEISGATFTPLPLAVAAPLAPSEPAGGASLDSTLLYDLEACGVFQLVPRQSFLAEAKEGVDASAIAWNRWTDVGAQGLVKVQVTSGSATLHLYDVAGKRQEMEKTFSGGDFRRLGHRIADEIWRYYTHEPGAFDTRMAFVRRESGVKSIAWSDYDGHDLQISGKAQLGQIDMLPSWSPDGGKLAFTHYRRTPQYPNGHPELWMLDVGGKPRALFAKGTLNTGAAFAPDGKEVAFTMSQGDGNTEIWALGADGLGLKRLTNTPAIDTSAAFSPDGKKVAFVSDRDGNPQIFLMNRDGSGATRLTRQGNYNQEPAWSPRGDEIAFTARDERLVFDIFVVNVESGQIRRITQDQGQNEHPTWAPNGRMLAFSSTRSGHPEIWVSSQDGRVQKRASPTDGASYSDPAWGPFRK